MIATFHETWLFIMRSKSFLGANIFLILLCFFSILANQWGVKEFEKIAYDVMTFGLHIGGSLYAILWATEAVSVGFDKGWVEYQLATPTKRSLWFLGKILGVCFSLLCLWMFGFVLFQILTKVTHLGWLNLSGFVVLGFQGLGWLILAFLGSVLGLFCKPSSTIAYCVLLWFIGNLAPLILPMLPPETGFFSRFLIETVAWVWNLQFFNLSLDEMGIVVLSGGSLMWCLGYWCSLCSMLYCLGVFIL
jgi:hypothetical protein